jgi:hypothetical protein
MVFPVHQVQSTVSAIMNCSDRGQFNASQTLRPVALQWICLIQESVDTAKIESSIQLSEVGMLVMGSL